MGLRDYVSTIELSIRKQFRTGNHYPLIQEALDNLGCKSWFSTLDQGKAYHQGFVSKESQPLTAIITPWGLFQWEHIPGDPKKVLLFDQA